MRKDIRNFTELAQAVADDFRETMVEFDFETFAEMAQCYRWSSADIKDEVGWILHNLDCDAYIDAVDGSLVIFGQQSMGYQEFSRLFRSFI